MLVYAPRYLVLLTMPDLLAFVDQLVHFVVSHVQPTK